jgi:hypothetical protein
MPSEKKKIGTTSTPSFFTFNPKVIPYQYRVVYDIKKKFFKEEGPPHYIMLSGSIGSAKSTLMAWLAIDHCVSNDGARVLLGRKALPDLKATIFQTILEMLAEDFIEGVDYWVRHDNGYIKFANGSEIISRSWHDKKYKKFRSLQLSMIVIEELTENDSKDWEFFVECIGRLGRLPHIKNNLFISATNPDDPSHPAYKEFIEGSVKDGCYGQKDSHTHVYYSRTEDNPFLPTWYIEKLKEKYDAKMIRRLLYGEWLYISTDVIYYNYDPEKHVVKKEEIKLYKKKPIRITFDFNISKGKPMSSCLFQFNRWGNDSSINNRMFKFFDEVAVEGARTRSALEEWSGKGWFDLPHNPKIIIHGDATGRRGDSRGDLSDYDIIEKYLANYVRNDGDCLEYEIMVPNDNPRIRDRHNKANGALENANKVVNVAINEECKFIKAGFANTRLKEAANYTEDQTTEGQDMSNSATYGMHYCIEYEDTSEEPIEFY